MSASASVTSSPPRLKDYVLTERLGSGTYATVYKAYKKGGRREVVAVKCIQKSTLNRASTENLLTEIELLKTLKHENIVELKDFQWDDSYIYLIMEYCSGGDLSRFIHTKRALAESSVRRFLQQIASALQCMRSKNVSHMDLKPQNILLSSREQPVLKLGDFGFAHYLVGEVDAVSLRGSPLYMAPEIITKRFYNEKADLWSVGVILYECLFGRAPFASRSIDELQAKIIDSKPIEIPYGVHISDHCRHLLKGLLQRDPNKRMSFEAFFQHKFVDLDHKPCQEALPKAVELVTKAVQHDHQEDHQSAITYYSEALEYFMPAIFYETDPKKKTALRVKVQEYMNRAEDLKQMLKPKQNTEASKSVSQPSREELNRLVTDERPLLKAALTTGCRAERKESAEQYEDALKDYEAAIETLIAAIHEDPKNDRRDLLQSQISVWLARAEEVKSYIKVKDLTTRNRLDQEGDGGLDSQGQCILQ